MRKKIRIIHLPSNVGGNPQGISKYMNKLGIRSLTMAFKQNHFNLSVDKVIQGKNDSRFLAEIKRFFSITYILNFDIVFFNYGSTLFPQYAHDSYNSKSKSQKFLFRLYLFYLFLMQRVELFLLKLLGRKIIIQYQGDDARQGDFCLNNFSINIASQVEENYYSLLSDKIKRKQIALLTKYSNCVYALNPDLMHVLPSNAKFLPYCSVDINDWEPKYFEHTKNKLRIGHAPTNRSVKGTDKIIKALKILELEGYQFEFVLIENMSNKEAKKIYKSIDVFVDQIYAGWYGAVAVELMALAKPVMVYLRDADLKFIPREMADDLPFLRTKPKTILDDLRSLLEMKDSELIDLSHKSRTYIEKWHDPEKIVKGIYSDIKNIYSEFNIS